MQGCLSSLSFWTGSALASDNSISPMFSTSNFTCNLVDAAKVFDDSPRRTNLTVVACSIFLRLLVSICRLGIIIRHTSWLQPTYFGINERGWTDVACSKVYVFQCNTCRGHLPLSLHGNNVHHTLCDGRVLGTGPTDSQHRSTNHVDR